MSHKFLTTRPLIRNHVSGTDDFIYILSKADALTPLNIDIIYADDTDENSTVSLSSVNKGDVFQYYLNYSSLAAVDSAKTIKKIEIYIDASNKIVYNIIEPKSSNVFNIIYRNSLGGYDSFQCEGDQSETLSTNSIVKRNSFPADYDYTFREYEDVSQQSTGRYNLNSGYKSRSEIKAFADAFHHKKVFVLHQEGDCKYLLPYRLLGNFQPPSIFDNLPAISFTIEEAATNQYLQLT